MFWLSLVLLLIALCGLGWFLIAALRKAPYEANLVTVERKDGEVAAYAVTYLLPFLTVFEGSWRDVLALALFVVFIGILYTSSNMVYVNPVLALFGYHLMVVQISTAPTGANVDGPKRYLLARSRWIGPGERLTVRDVSPEVIFAFPEDNER